MAAPEPRLWWVAPDGTVLCDRCRHMLVNPGGLAMAEAARCDACGFSIPDMPDARSVASSTKDQREGEDR